uniref:hydrogen gas-evolving membrane-bound hydrogenase subunit E n=1 Tax=Nocardiopsis alkaliphila TaxID=225762 RepID=UPI00036AD3DF
PATVAALAGLSMAGIPPLLGFVSKENVFKGLLESPGPEWVGVLAGGVAVLASVVTFAYTFRFVYEPFWGSPREPDRSASEGDLGFVAPSAIAAGLGLVLGLAVVTLNPMAERVAADATGQEEAKAELALWHGLSVDLFMSLAAIALGVLLVWWTASGERLAGRRLFPVEGTTVFDALHSGIIRLGRRIGDLTRSDAPPQHLVMPLLLVVVLASGLTVTGLDVAEPAGDTSHFLDWLLVVLILAAVLGLMTTSSRMATLVLVGVAGFSTALWLFLLGAFDVALTQLMVEILTVVIAALVLRRLPKRFQRISTPRKLATGVVALATGLSAALGTYYLTGRRERSQVSEYFLENSEEDTGGTNVVNTILVDYRALDTLGELVVLGVAGLIIIAVLNSSGLLSAHGDRRLSVRLTNPVYDADDNTLVMRSVGYVLLPLIVFWSLTLFLRGHTNVGGGFIAGLVGGAGFALIYLAAPSASVARISLAYPRIIGAGVVVSVLTGLLGYLDGSFLRPLHDYVPLPLVGDYHLTTALLFDVGVYLTVVGVVLTALNQLGVDESLPGESTGGTMLPTEDQPPTNSPGDQITSSEDDDRPIGRARVDDGGAR